MDTLPLVAEFMTTAGQDVPASLTPPDIETRKLRLSLELEELLEKAEAFGLKRTFANMLYAQVKGFGSFSDTQVFDAEAVLDAMCDQRYVNDGTILACGLGPVFNDAFSEVHRSNMSKFCPTMNDAAQASVAYAKKGVDVRWGASGSLWVVRRASDNKILKSLKYLPPNLLPYIT